MARSRAANQDKHPNVPRIAWTVDELCAGGEILAVLLRVGETSRPGP
jgi:hypothetical protein